MPKIYLNAMVMVKASQLGQPATRAVDGFLQEVEILDSR